MKFTCPTSHDKTVKLNFYTLVLCLFQRVTYGAYDLIFVFFVHVIKQVFSKGVHLVCLDGLDADF